MLTRGVSRSSRYRTGYQPKVRAPTESLGTAQGTNRKSTTVGTEGGRPRRRTDVQNRNKSRASVSCGAKRYRVEPGVIWLMAHFIVCALIRLSAHNKFVH